MCWKKIAHLETTETQGSLGSASSFQIVLECYLTPPQPKKPQKLKANPPDTNYFRA